MTDPTHDERLEREIRNFLAWQADDIADAPSSTEVAMRIGAGARPRALQPRVGPQLGLVMLVGLLIAALVGAALIGASLLRDDPVLVDFLQPTASLEPNVSPQPETSPANGWIAVAANPKLGGLGHGENGDIYLLDEATGASPITTGARLIIGSDGDGVAQACPRFSPDGRMLAYGEARASGTVTTFRGRWPVVERAIVVVGLNAEGDASPPIMRVALAPEIPGEMACPEWSPLGGHIAFRAGSELWVADSATGETDVFPVADAPWGQLEFEWSRDGSRIAVSEPGQILVVRIDGAMSTVIPVNGASPGSLGWATGDRIFYKSTDAPGDGIAINAVGADGNSDIQLTSDVAGVQLRFDNAAVSPDGTRVAYVKRSYRCVSDGCTQDPARVLVMDPDGSDEVEVPIPPDFGAGGLQWSPDGERLLFGWIDGVVSVGVEAGSLAVVHSRRELDLEWSASEMTWQPVYP